jgi:hypothetical protein
MRRSFSLTPLVSIDVITSRQQSGKERLLVFISEGRDVWVACDGDNLDASCEKEEIFFGGVYFLCERESYRKGL